MKIYGDFHTHSTYSKFKHGKNTVAEMVEAAQAKGLSFLAITDHGPKHLAFGIKRKNIDKARYEIDEINKENKIKRVYFGLEANLIGKDGSIDLTQEEIDKLDILIVGYHRGTLNNIVKPFCIGANSKRQIELQTRAYVNLVNKYDVDFITHLCEYVQVDCKRVAEECAKTGTLLEINNRHYRWTDEQMKDILSTDVKFIVSSDAHKRSRIAFVDDAMEVVRKFNIPEERIVNFSEDYVPKKFRKDENKKDEKECEVDANKTFKPAIIVSENTANKNPKPAKDVSDIEVNKTSKSAKNAGKKGNNKTSKITKK